MRLPCVLPALPWAMVTGVCVRRSSTLQHSAIESMWFQYAMEDVPHAVAEATGDIPAVRWISMNTDPWNMVFPSSGQER